MHYKRVIPCLDVDAGRVVKGVGFVDLRDAGDPVELASRYDAAGADERGRGQAAMVVTAMLSRAGSGTKVGVTQDLQISGAAAQYGRGMISDVSAVLMRDFATNLAGGIARVERGESLDAGAPAVSSASGLAVGLRAAMMALRRVFRRFFLPYQPSPS